MPFFVGSQPFCDALFTDAANGPIDPPLASVTVLTRDPNLSETSYAGTSSYVSRPALGVVRFTFPAALTTAGTWTVRFKCTATVVGAGEQTFVVTPSAFTSP
jgi:hypothetical protein